VIDRIRREPVLATGLLEAILALALAFGLDLTPEQVGAILAVAVALLALVARRQVTPTTDPRLEHQVTLTATGYDGLTSDDVQTYVRDDPEA
jgi:hypothetical protein